MTRSRHEHALAELELARRRRELSIWTVRAWLGTVVLAGLTVAVLVALAEGRLGELQTVLGSGALGVGSMALTRSWRS